MPIVAVELPAGGLRRLQRQRASQRLMAWLCRPRREIRRPGPPWQNLRQIPTSTTCNPAPSSQTASLSCPLQLHHVLPSLSFTITNNSVVITSQANAANISRRTPIGTGGKSTNHHPLALHSVASGETPCGRDDPSVTPRQMLSTAVLLWLIRSIESMDLGGRVQGDACGGRSLLTVSCPSRC